MRGDIIELTQQSLWLIIVLAGPPVAVAAIVGIIIAFVQAATQLQEQSFQYAAKFFAVVVTIFITSSLMGSTLYQFSIRVFEDIPTLVGG